MRPLRGSSLSAFQPGVPDPLPSVFESNSAFQLQEYIALLIRADVHDVDRIVSVPTPGPNVPETDKDIDEGCWVYEHLRRLAQDLTHPLITTLQQECTRKSCPEMKAGEWLYLCVAHGGGGTTECCAIDYIIHTLDSATSVLNSPRAFPSRISIPQASHRHFSSLARRLSRVFAHAYFHHREAFEQSEAETSLYARFLALSQKFELVPPEFLVIPTRDPAATIAAPEPPAPLAQLTTTDNSDKSSNSPNSDSPAETLSPNSLSRLGRPRTDTMFFSGDFNFMQAIAAAGGSPLQGAAPDQSKFGYADTLPPAVDLDQPSASADAVPTEAPAAPHAGPLPLPQATEPEFESAADTDPFADPVDSTPAPAANEPEPESENALEAPPEPEAVSEAVTEAAPAPPDVPAQEEDKKTDEDADVDVLARDFAVVALEDAKAEPVETASAETDKPEEKEPEKEPVHEEVKDVPPPVDAEAAPEVETPAPAPAAEEPVPAPAEDAPETTPAPEIVDEQPAPTEKAADVVEAAKEDAAEDKEQPKPDAEEKQETTST